MRGSLRGGLGDAVDGDGAWPRAVPMAAPQAAAIANAAHATRARRAITWILGQRRPLFGFEF